MQYTLLPDQSVQPLPRDNHILNFLDAEGAALSEIGGEGGGAGASALSGGLSGSGGGGGGGGGSAISQAAAAAAEERDEMTEHELAASDRRAKKEIR